MEQSKKKNYEWAAKNIMLGCLSVGKTFLVSVFVYWKVKNKNYLN